MTIYKVLAQKWRPRDFTSVVGQQTTLTALVNSLNKNKLHHAYLFTGTRGIGKTTLARILAKAMNCENGISATPCGHCQTCEAIDNSAHPDVLEIDAASRTKVEDTRELLDKINYAPISARFKVYIIDEVHMLSTHSFNALLKTMEEPPAHVKFILATTESNKIPITIKSRCLKFNLRKFTINEIIARLEYILHTEKLEYENGVLEYVARAADGSLRDALSICEQIIAFAAASTKITFAACEQVLGVDAGEQILHLLKLILNGEAQAAIGFVQELEVQGVNFIEAIKQLQHNLHQIALKQMIPAMELEFNASPINELAQLFTPDLLQIFYQSALQAMEYILSAPTPKLAFEMLVLRMLYFEPMYTNTLAVNNSTAPINQEPNLSTSETTKESKTSASFATSTKMPEVTAKDAKIDANAATESASSISTKIPEVTAKDGEIDVNASASPTLSTSLEWEQVLAKLNFTGLTKVLAKHLIFHAKSKDKLQFKIDVMYNNLLNATHVDKITSELTNYLGAPVNLDIQVAQIEQSSTPYGREQQQLAKEQQDTHDKIMNSQIVRGLQAELGAKIESIDLE